jgi:hypothetical protein
MEENKDVIGHILERNKRVETDKAWETSFTRRGFIMVITYCTASLFLFVIGNPQFWANAIVPAAGYLLSTLSLPSIKQWWITSRRSLP